MINCNKKGDTKTFPDYKLPAFVLRVLWFVHFFYGPHLDTVFYAKNTWNDTRSRIESRGMHEAVLADINIFLTAYQFAFAWASIESESNREKRIIERQQLENSGDQNCL